LFRSLVAADPQDLPDLAPGLARAFFLHFLDCTALTPVIFSQKSWAAGTFALGSVRIRRWDQRLDPQPRQHPIAVSGWVKPWSRSRHASRAAATPSSRRFQ